MYKADHFPSRWKPFPNVAIVPFVPPPASSKTSRDHVIAWCDPCRFIISTTDCDCMSSLGQSGAGARME